MILNLKRMENFTTVPLYTGYYTNSSIESMELYGIDNEDYSIRLFSAVCYSLVFCISLPSNSFLLWVLLLRQRGKRTPPDCLLLQLAISDLFLTVTLPFWASYQLHGWSFGDWACKMTSGLFTLGLDAYMMLLTAMTLDRYVAVVHAASPSAQGRRALWVRGASVAIWLVCVAVSIWIAYNSKTILDDSGVSLCEDVSDPLARLLNAYLHIGLFCLLPFAVVFFCYFRIFMTVRRCAMKGQQQAVKLIAGITVVFFVCWVPYNVVLFLETLAMLDVESLQTDALFHGGYVTHTLAYCHCCLNPLFHVFGAGKFWRHLPLPGVASYRRGESSRQTLSSTTNSQNH